MFVDIFVPSDQSFKRGVTECENFVQPDVVDGCRRENLVDIRHTIDMAVKAVERVVMQNSTSFTGAVRCSPIVYPRLARGGKSTFLRLLFDNLKEDPRFAPIILTFNGGFYPRPHESARQAIVRSIACQLANIDKSEQPRVVCDEKALLQYIEESRDGKAVVLLIDELNMLGAPLDNDASVLLKENFLDPINRALVFTSHLVVDLDYFTKGWSPRGLYVVPMPFCKDVDLLKQMAPHCAQLTPLQAVIYGYIPSMIYSFFDPSNYLSLRRVVEIAHVNIDTAPECERLLVVGSFVKQCLDGVVVNPSDDKDQWLKLVRQFDRFASVPESGMVQFPIGYIGLLLDKLRLIRDTKIADWFSHLLTYAASTHSGKDWEIIVQFAVLLRCADICINCDKALSSPVHFFETRSLTFVAGSSKMELVSLTIPKRVKSLDDAKKWFSEQGSTFTVPTLLITTPCSNLFPSFDMLIALYRPHEKIPQVVALQCKSGGAYPTNTTVPDWIHKAFLFQGRQGWSDGNDPVVPEKWEYLSAEQVQAFLGYSLGPLYPGTDWNKKALKQK